MKRLPLLLSLVLINLSSIAYAAVEDCSHGVSFDNGSTFANVTGTVVCHLRDHPNIKTQEVSLVNGKKHGKRTLYGAFLNSAPRSAWQRVYMIEHYSNGEQQGAAQTFDLTSGKMEVERQYNNGRETATQHAGQNKVIQAYGTGDRRYDSSKLSRDAKGNITQLVCMDIPTNNAELNRLCGFSQNPGPVIKINNGMGITTSQQYCKGRPCGTTVQTYANGQKAAEYTVENGKKVERFYNPDGTMEQEQSRSKNKDQQVKQYFPDGKLKAILTWAKNEPTEITVYYQNGKKRYNAKKNNQTQLVTAVHYHDNGVKSEEYQFKVYPGVFLDTIVHRGELVNVSREYAENGRIIREITWNNGDISRIRKFDKNTGKLTKDESYYPDGSRK